MHTLISIGYSPWSWRAKAALDLAGEPYRRREFLFLLGEVELRARLGVWSGPVSVPVLVPDDGPAIADSLAIALWAAKRHPARLFAPEQEADVRTWSDLGDAAASAGRALTTTRTLHDEEALWESLPPFARVLGRGPGLAIGRYGASRLLSKYNMAAQSEDSHRATLAGHLNTLRAALDGKPWLLGTFTYADVAACVAVSFVRPHASAPLGEASRRRWTDDALVAEYGDLIAWRDRVVEQVGVLRQTYSASRSR